MTKSVHPLPGIAVILPQRERIKPAPAETAVAQTNKLATIITQEIEERGAFHNRPLRCEMKEQRAKSKD
jgi:hypothetical protein